MNQFGISGKSTALIRQSLASFKEIDRAVIFGSRAKGNYQDGSDIDLAIYGSDLQPDTADKLHAVLNQEQPIPYSVDVLAPQYLKHEALLEHIKHVGIPFYRKKAAREWRKVRFENICSITRGGSPRPIQDYISENGTPWVKIADATSSNSRYINKTKEFIKTDGENKSRVVYPGDLIVSNSATPGLSRFMKIRACIHDGWLLLRDIKINKIFLYYVIIKERSALLMKGNGSIFTNLNTDILKQHLISLPPLSEQRAIAEVLSSLDDKIELLHRQNQSLEQLAETLFRQWFVEPLKKAALERKTSKGFTKGTFSSWICGTLGGDWGKGDKQGEFTQAVNCIRGIDIADLNAGGVAKKTPIRFIKQKKFESIEPKNGDLLIGISGGGETQSTGRTTYINDDVKHFFNHPLVFSNFCRMIRVKKVAYSFHLLLSPVLVQAK